MPLDDGERQVAPELIGIRRDHVARYEFAASAIGERKKVLDIACGVGYGSAILADAGHSVVAIDRSAEAIDYAGVHYARLGLIIHKQADAFDLDFGFNAFDVAVCFETIEHLENPLPFLKMLNTAAPVLIASVPNEAVFPFRGYKFHYRHYTAAEFEALLNAAGYEVTGWFGQSDCESDVEPEIEGRTIVVTAARASAPQIMQRASKCTVPERVAILGLGPSLSMFLEMAKRLGGSREIADEVWGINALGGVFACDRIFHMDDVRVQEIRAAAKPESNIANMLKWMRKHPGPIYTSRVRDGYPGMVEFPLEDVLNAKLDSNGGAPYFNSTAAYPIAYAIWLGVKEILPFGLDYTRANSHEAEKGRACVEFWLGIAAARGIKITLTDQTTLLDACEPPEARLYGYDCVDVWFHDQPDGSVQLTFDEKAAPTAAEIEARYDHSKHPNRLVAEELAK